MANYAVTDFTTGPATLVVVLAALETYLETVTDSKAIRNITVAHIGGDMFVASVLHDA